MLFQVARVLFPPKWALNNLPIMKLMRPLYLDMQVFSAFSLPDSLFFFRLPGVYVFRWGVHDRSKFSYSQDKSAGVRGEKTGQCRLVLCDCTNAKTAPHISMRRRFCPINAYPVGTCSFSDFVLRVRRLPYL